MRPHRFTMQLDPPDPAARRVIDRHVRRIIDDDAERIGRDARRLMAYHGVGPRDLALYIFVPFGPAHVMLKPPFVDHGAGI